MAKSFKEKIGDRDICLGAWLTMQSPQIAEVMASCGFDWLCVDIEHTPLDESDTLLAFMAAERHGAAPVARLPSADPFLARRLLDAGAQGLIVPVVEDSRRFSEFADHCLYPPKGRRGMGLSRANLWGDRFDEYTGDFEPVLVAQVETRKGVANIDEIAALEAVDAVFLGPYDLSADLGQPGNFETEAFADAIDSVRSACEREGKAAGYHQVAPDMAALRERIAEGYRLLAYATDVVAMRQAFTGIRELIASTS